jgi:hypothetical protein
MIQYKVKMIFLRIPTTLSRTKDLIKVKAQKQLILFASTSSHGPDSISSGTFHEDASIDIRMEKNENSNAGHLPIATYGVFRENEKDDLNILVNYFTVPALARALREREQILQKCAFLQANNRDSELKALLYPFLKENVDKRRLKKRSIDLSAGFTRKGLVMLQKYLHRMPRQVFQAFEKRASVVVPLCNVNGVASVLFERRSDKVSRHKQQVCFPGGMVDEVADSTIIQTSLREMSEELGIPEDRHLISNFMP